MEISRGISHEVIWYTAHKKLVHVQIYESKCQPAVNICLLPSGGMDLPSCPRGD